MTQQELTITLQRMVKDEINRIITPLVNELKTQRTQIQKLNEVIRNQPNTNFNKTNVPQQMNNNQYTQQYYPPVNNNTSTLIPPETEMYSNVNYDPRFENNPLLQEMLNKNYGEVLQKANERAKELKNKPQIL